MTTSVNKNDCLSSGYEYISGDLTGYDVDSVIKKIKDSFAAGKKVALFIGREHTEELPQKKGFIWFSLDSRNPNLEKGSNRRDFHLHINFNHKERLSKIERLFDEVVVDRETYKWFASSPKPILEDKKGPGEESIKSRHWEIAKQLMSLLKPGGDEKLICDFDTRNAWTEHGDEVYLERQK